MKLIIFLFFFVCALCQEVEDKRKNRRCQNANENGVEKVLREETKPVVRFKGCKGRAATVRFKELHETGTSSRKWNLMQQTPLSGQNFATAVSQNNSLEIRRWVAEDTQSSIYNKVTLQVQFAKKEFGKLKQGSLEWSIELNKWTFADPSHSLALDVFFDIKGVKRSFKNKDNVNGTKVRGKRRKQQIIEDFLLDNPLTFYCNTTEMNVSITTFGMQRINLGNGVKRFGVRYTFDNCPGDAKIYYDPDMQEAGTSCYFLMASVVITIITFLQ